MSTTVIARLYAFAETPGIPPTMISENALADLGAPSLGEEADFSPEDLPEAGAAEIDLTQVGLSESEGVGEGATPENPTHITDELAISGDTQSSRIDPDLRLYRKRTIGILRRYMRLSIEVGRLPSLLGREFFRTRVTSYRASTFEDAVIFVHDVERSLDKLSEFDKKLIAKIVLQEYSYEEAARLIGCGLRHTARCYTEALDRVSETFLKRKLLLRLPTTKPDPQKSCQGGKGDDFELSDSKQAENKF
jgi:hypothetical protein